MSYKLKKKLANPKNYGGLRTQTVNFIVIHYTGNDGDRGKSNANYFANNIVKASAHYFVDDDSVTLSVPEDHVAWSVGGALYSGAKAKGGASQYKICTNANSISIELCDTVKDGKIYPTAATIENALELTRELMKKYNIDADHVIRHFDVNGKPCPAYWTDKKKWESAFHDRLTEKKDPTPSGEFLVRVSISDLWIRKGAGTDTAKIKKIKPGAYTIKEVKAGKGSTKGWGLLKSGAGWISLDYATRV